MDKDKIARPDHQRRLKAAEIALGLIDARESHEALGRDPSLRREITHWQQDLSWLADELLPVAPPYETWAGLKAQVDAERAATAGSPASPFAKLMENLSWWRALSGTGLVTAAALAAVLLLRAPVELQTPGSSMARSQIVLVSLLFPKDGPPLFIASFDAASATVIAIPVTSEPIQGGVPHLWLVPKDDRDPIDLGALVLSRPSKFILQTDIAAQADREASLVITLEASIVIAGGAARGPVIAHGVFVQP